MSILTGLLNILLVLSSIFLICLVLIQRGKGGGLAGAFGGVGGSSAFGTKAGDVFTRVTIVTACIWFVLAMMLVIVNNQDRQSAFDLGTGGGSQTKVELPGTAEADAAAKAATSTKAATTPGGTTSPAAIPAPVTSDLPSALEDEPVPSSATPAKTP